MIRDLIVNKNPAAARRLVSLENVIDIDIPDDIRKLADDDLIDAPLPYRRAFQKLVDCDYRGLVACLNDRHVDDVIAFIAEREETVLIGGERPDAHPVQYFNDEDYFRDDRRKVTILLSGFIGGRAYADYEYRGVSLEPLVEIPRVMCLPILEQRSFDARCLEYCAERLWQNGYGSMYKAFSMNKRHLKKVDKLHFPYMFNIITDLVINEKEDDAQDIGSSEL